MSEENNGEEFRFRKGDAVTLSEAGLKAFPKWPKSKHRGTVMATQIRAGTQVMVRRNGCKGASRYWIGFWNKVGVKK